LFSLDLEALPNHAVHLLSPGKYRLFVKIVAANHDALDRLIEFEITGAWIPNDVSKMLSEGLIMELKTLPR
jgi:hypothetical protein